ncbi:hypothetical protein BC830DRAFT_1146637 [Chytriomyces sp. MP71]|nr:hypothetical protein BC830DRAFT_1146637 [Chytriomyces sp. MP71]
MNKQNGYMESIKPKHHYRCNKTGSPFFAFAMANNYFLTTLNDTVLLQIPSQQPAIDLVSFPMNLFCLNDVTVYQTLPLRQL